VNRLATFVAALVLFGFATSCAAAPPSPLDPVVARVWPAGSLPRGANVRWTVGTPPAGFGAWTEWTCIVACEFTVTVGPGYVTDEVVAHEGGHVVCMTLWRDPTEACADAHRP
jgi:hypothetical protein